MSAHKLCAWFLFRQYCSTASGRKTYFWSRWQLDRGWPGSVVRYADFRDNSRKTLVWADAQIRRGVYFTASSYWVVGVQADDVKVTEGATLPDALEAKASRYGVAEEIGPLIATT